MDKRKPLVAVLILSWNESDFTINCVKDLSKIDYPNFKIMILDNGSRKEESEKIKKIKNAQIFRTEENLGFTGGNNYLIEKALKDESVDYFLCINNDTILNEKFLGELIKVAEENPKIGCLGPLVFDKTGKLSVKDTPGHFNFYIGGAARIRNWQGKANNNKPLMVGYVSGCCMLFRRKVMEKTRGFPQEYFMYNEETELCYRVKKLGYLSCAVPKSKIIHMVSGTTSKISGFRQKLLFRNTIWFEMKYGNTLQKIVFLFYLFGFKIPKRFLMNIRGGDSNKKNSLLVEAIKEGLLTRN